VPAATDLVAGSWNFEPRVMIAYRPDVWSSYIYAGAAGTTAQALERWDAKRATVYRDSALKAMRWAEALWPGYKYADRPEVRRDRAWAGAVLFRLTGDAAWNDVFRDSFAPPRQAPACPWQEFEPAWVYARTDRPGTDPELQQECRWLLTANADFALGYVDKTAFGWAKQADWFRFISCASSPKFGPALVRAYVLTHERKYLDGAVRTCQTGLGANPLNICYTCGLGDKSIEHPLDADLLASHEPCPAGIAVNGPIDLHYLVSESYFRKGDQWTYYVMNRWAYPDLKLWPAMESYFDEFWLPTTSERMVQTTESFNAYTWGFLAAHAAPAAKE